MPELNKDDNMQDSSNETNEKSTGNIPENSSESTKNQSEYHSSTSAIDSIHKELEQIERQQENPIEQHAEKPIEKSEIIPVSEQKTEPVKEFKMPPKIQVPALVRPPKQFQKQDSGK